jgi:ribonuclease BN (tRNA processing enzyme)
MRGKMKIEWVNHASYIFQYKNTRIIADPWLFGSAFNDGWDLLVETQFKVEAFKDITHIWFSHEHPDHFAPQVLGKIDEEVRKKITVLFQKTTDKRVVNFCKKLSFKVVELPHRTKFVIEDDFSITCGKMAGIDSWLLYETNRFKLLNINDCVISNKKLCESVKKTTGEVDVLMSQFSYANWKGNPDDKKIREKSAREKLNRIKIQTEIFSPKHTIPFASFVYFSHDENKYMNDSINTISTAHEYINNNTDSESIVMYPGDTWDFESKFNNEKSIKLYDKAYSQISNLNYRSLSTTVSDKELLQASQKYLSSLSTNNSSLAMSMYRYIPFFGAKNIIIKLFDTKKYYQFGWSKGLIPLSNSGSNPDIEMSSESLLYVLSYPWGFGTLMVNGRFRSKDINHTKSSRIFMLGLMNSIDKRLSIKFIFKEGFAKIFGKGLSTEEEWSLHRHWPRFLKNK